MRGVTPALCRRDASVLTEPESELVTEAPCIMSHLEDKEMVRSCDVDTGQVLTGQISRWH